MRFTIHADGGSRGNPGPAGAGAIVRDENGVAIAKVSDYLGRATNNIAEYTGILRGLEALLRHVGDDARATDVDVRMDSELVIKQMNGLYKIKHPNLVPLAARVKELVPEFRSVTFTHVYREQNKDADKLANEAMDLGR